MSKKMKKILVLFLSFLTLFVVTALGVACVDDKSESESVSSPGDVVEKPAPIAKTYNWNGLKDFNLKISDTDYAYDEVSVTDNEGLYYALTVDDSAVTYGVKGEYTVKFTVDDQVKEQKVKIYDLPQISVEETVSFTYEQVMNRSSVGGLFANVTATDCFGTVIPVGIKESQDTASFYRQDGSVNYGEYTVVLATVDGAGQMVEEEITFTVERNETNEPVIDGEDITVDVVDERQALNLSLKNREVVAVSINGVVVNTESLIVNEQGVITALDLTTMDLLELGADNVIRVITSGGYTEKTITLTDEKDAVMDVSGRELQTVILGDKPTIIQPKKVYPKQNFDIVLNLVSPSGESIDVTKTNFEADEIGTYVLTATAKRNGVKCGEVMVNYNVHQAYNSFRTEQERVGVYAYKSIYWTDSCVQTGTVGYEVDETRGGKTGNYMAFGFASASYLGFKIPTSLSLAEIEDLKTQGVEEVFVNVFVDSLYEKCVRYTLVKKGSLDDNAWNEGDTVGAKIIIEPLTWTKLSISIDYIIQNYTALQNGEAFLFNVYNGGDGLDKHENFRMYFSEMLFDLPLPDIQLAEDELNTFANIRYFKGAKAYRNISTATPAVDGVELALESGEVGGAEGNFAKVNIGVYSNGSTQVAPSQVGVTFPMLKTLQEIQALKNSGYTSLAVPMYIDCTQDKKVMGKIFTVGESAGSVGWLNLPAQTWTTFIIPIDDLIANYAGLADGTKILLPIVNSGVSGEVNQAYFNVYYGAMKFTKVMNTTYNACENTEGFKAWQYAYSADAMRTNELYQEQVSSAGGKTGNFLRLQVGLAGRTIPSYVGITIAPTITLEELNALKTAGYTSLSIDYYFENDADSAVKSDFKWVYKNDVFTYGETNSASKVAESVGEWHTLTIDIQKIIDNYDGLVNSTKYIMMITNNSNYSDHSTVFYTYFGNMEFVKNN